MLPSRRFFFLIPVFFAITSAAQDTRQISEPKIPATCSTLTAVLRAKNGVLSDADEQKLDTSRIQSAIDGCTAGRAVVLRAHGEHSVFLTGPLTLKSGVTLVVSARTVLAASRDPRVFDLAPGSCGIVSIRGHGCRGLITVNDASGNGIMGDGSIDGRGGADLLGQKVSWQDLAHEAKVTDQQQSVPWMIMLRNSRDFTLYRITLRNSPGFHVSVNQTDGFTAWGVKIMTPKTARNTDGIDPGSSRNVTITRCFIRTGDDNVAVKSSKAGPASNISVLHNHFYTGHGMSIGSGTDGGVEPGHTLYRQQEVHGRRRKPHVRACAAVLLQLLHRGQRRLHLRGWKNCLRQLRDSQHDALGRLRHRVGQELCCGRLWLRLQSLPPRRL
jgi:polygalacturonase